MVVGQIPDCFDTGTFGGGKSLDGMMAGHEAIAHGRHAMFSRDPVVVENASLSSMPGCNEEVVATAVNEAALEPRDHRALEERFGLKWKGMLQLM